ncbi:MAG TPA: hypothetical protein VFS67_20840 [Polyangiaceae bacterium]|jgi:hypothetical protein|nr:hypothetical protein [Polyangiaceae bacterium]
MSKMADARGSKRGRPESGLEKAASAAAGFAPLIAQRSTSARPPALPTGGETMQYQVPLELLVLARNREKDKARSVAVTPVAPRPSPDEPPPSSELSALRAKPQEPAPPATLEQTSDEPSKPSGEPSKPSNEQPAASNSAVSAPASLGTTLGLLLAAALCVVAGYCAVKLLYLF